MEFKGKIKNLDNIKIGDKISDEIVIYKDEYKVETIRNNENEKGLYPQIKYFINSDRNGLIESSSILITKKRYNSYLESLKK